MKGGVKKHGHLILLILIFILAFYIIYLSRIFIIPLITAALFSYISYPLFLRIKSKTKHPRWSSVLSVLIITFLVLIPTLVAMFFIGKEIFNVVYSFNIDVILSKIDSIRELINSTLNLNLNYADFSSIIKSFFINYQEILVSSSLWILNGVTKIIFQVIFVLIFMYNFYLYGPIIFNKSKAFLPFSESGKNIVLEKFQNDVKALFLGQGLVAVVQGILAGISFAIVGINNVFLWGFMTSIMSFIPMIGTAAIWVPVSIYLFFSGAYYSSLFIFLWGIFLVSNIDNFLRPYIVQSFSKIDFLTVLIGVIIGIKAFNLIGIIIGPLLISILISLVQVYYEETVNDNKKKNKKVIKRKKRLKSD